MNWKRIVGIVILIVGVALIFGSNYIKSQVEIGKAAVSEAQGNMELGKALFSLNPVTKQVNEGLQSGIQAKIQQGTETIAHYENIANELMIFGIGASILGILLIVFGRSRRRHE